MQVGAVYRHNNAEYFYDGGIARNVTKYNDTVMYDNLGDRVRTLPSVEEGPEAAVQLAQETMSNSLDQYPDDKSVSRYCIVVASHGFWMPMMCWGPCHAQMNNTTGLVGALITSPNVKMWKTWNKSGSSRDGRDNSFLTEECEPDGVKFWDWLLRESPYKGCFDNPKGAYDAEDEGVFLNISAPANLVCNAITATRMPHEYPNRVKMWARLVERGADPVAALVLSEQFITKKTNGVVTIAPRPRRGDIHDMFCSRPSIQMVRRIRELDLAATFPPLKEECTFGGQHVLWGNGTSLDVVTQRLKAGPGPKLYAWKWGEGLVEMHDMTGVRWESALDQITEMAELVKEKAYA